MGRHIDMSLLAGACEKVGTESCKHLAPLERTGVTVLVTLQQPCYHLDRT
ncbi:MAG: hypothetical protein HY314_01990 [Acidobacteria bacterium]|nr:hypothetical protein [Acidobacteriota bacterium]